MTYGIMGAATASQQWDLDMLGNWKQFIRDASGNGTYGDSADLVDDRDHNAANEIEESSLRHDDTTPTPVNVPFSYDDAGNIKTAQLETTGVSANLVNRKYIHDAWNRLVEVVHNNGTTGTSDDFALARYLYNGLHWRVWKQANTAEAPAYSSPTPQVVQRRAMFYDAAWRLIHQEMDDGVAPGSNLPTWPVSQGTWTPDRAEQLFWGARYIDDAVGRRQSTAITDADDPTPTVTWGDLQHYLTDAQFSVVALMDTGKTPGYDVIERARYTPYGFGLQCTPRDYNGSGQYSADDISAAIGYYAGAQFMGDVNRSGNISVDDWIVFATLNNTAFADAPDSSGWISHPDAASGGAGGSDNCIGYCGYVHNPETGDYTVRYRTYVPGLGRWGERDPAGYVDGQHLMEYVMSSPVQGRDPLGLEGFGDIDYDVLRKLLADKPSMRPYDREQDAAFCAWAQKTWAKALLEATKWSVRERRCRSKNPALPAKNIHLLSQLGWQLGSTIMSLPDGPFWPLVGIWEARDALHWLRGASRWYEGVGGIAQATASGCAGAAATQAAKKTGLIVGVSEQSRNRDA